MTAPEGSDQLVSDWVRFDSDRVVTVFTGRVELGQGNLTALLQMAADELCLDPEDITLVPADTARTPDEGYTAGSMSISVGGMALRRATSAARVLVLAEAARRLNAAVTALSVNAGTIMKSGEATGEDLRVIGCDLELDIPVADHADPLPREARKFSGTSAPRIDMAARVLGTPFVHDLRPEGVLHGRMVRSSALGATLKSVDLDGLRARPGVVEVVRDGSFLGLLAMTSWQAVRAQEWAQRNTEWGAPPGPDVTPLEVVQQADGPVQDIHTRDGERPATAKSFEVTATRPFISHGSIGPSAGLAIWEDDRLSVKSHSQGVFQLRGAMATVLGIDADKITITHTPGAGCYGHNGADDAAMDAAILARHVPGRPVLVVWSRAEEFCNAPLGPVMATKASAGVDDFGRIQSVDVSVNSVPHANRPGTHGAPNVLAGTQLATPIPFPVSQDLGPERGGGADRNSVPYYSIPSVAVTKRLVHDLPYRSSSLRGLGATVNVVAIEALMDQIACETGQDPAELRLAHLNDTRAQDVIRAVMEMSENHRVTDEGTGWGLAFARYKNSAGYAAIVASVLVDEEVRVTKVSAAIDAGEVINPDGAINQTEGGIIQSISWALKEQLNFEGANVATETWLDYPILTFSEVPDIAVQLIERPDDPPLGCAEAVQGAGRGSSFLGDP